MNEDHLDDLRAALRDEAARIVEAFRGQPNRAASSRKEIRWGNKGSFALQIAGPAAGLWYDHEVGRGGDILDLIQIERDCSFIEALSFAEQFVGCFTSNIPPKIFAEKNVDDSDEIRRIEQALNVWADVQPLRGSLAEKYLRSRSIEVPDEALDALAFHPACPWETHRVPALVALVRDIITGEPSGVHRTALTPDGIKIGRKVLGPKAGGAIKLSRIITAELTIGEGIETTLSAMMLGYSPAWSVIDAGGLKTFPVLPDIKRITLIVDNDASGTGQAAAEECRERWCNAGKRVLCVMPPNVGDDLNDVLMKRGAAR